MKILYAILMFFFFYGSASGGVLKGKVTDDKGERLPYATIFLEGTTIGVNANGNGDFELQVTPGLYKVLCQYVGYKQTAFNVSFAANETVEHTFVLQRQDLEMKEVVIHANTEDPAYGIIRNTIRQRYFHLQQVKSFQTSIYFKGVMRSRKLPEKFMGQKVKDETDDVDSAGKGILFLSEEDADYYSAGDRHKTVIHTVRESGNPGGVGFSQFPHVITFYENNVNIMGRESRGFISPVSDNALFYYKYRLLGQFEEQGHTIYKIKVMQKRNYEPCFNGNIYIVDGDWAIHSLDMTLAKQSGMDIMDTLKVSQLFLPLQKDTWVIKSQVIYFTVNMLGFDIAASGVTVYNKQKVNQPIPDSILDGKVVSVYDKNANKKDSTYFKDARPIPLETDESRNYVVKDSLNKKFTSPQYIDSVRRRKNRHLPFSFLSQSVYNGKKYKNTYSINPIFGFGMDNMVNFNIVEGFNVSPIIKWRHLIDTGKNLYGDVATRYGFSNMHFNAIGRLYYVHRNRAFLNSAWLYGAEGGKYVFQYNPDNPVLPWYNTFADLFSRQNDLKIYERWEGAAFVRRSYGTGFSWAAKASFQRRIPLQNTTDFSFVKGSNEGYTSNTVPELLKVATAWEEHNAALLWAAVSYRPGTTYTEFPDYKVATNTSAWPRFTLSYDKGIPGIFNSLTDFDKWRFNVQGEFRLRLFGNLLYNVAAGGFLNTNYVSFPDLMHLYGNRGFGLATPYLQSFQFAQYYQFSNKEPLYGEGHLEYHMKGLLSNKIPLLRQAQWHLLVGGNAFYARQDLYYSEAFVGIDNIGWKAARGLRIDFVQSWDSNSGHNSGIRFGLSLITYNTLQNSATHSEW
jgi:hypothetical protein